MTDVAPPGVNCNDRPCRLILFLAGDERNSRLAQANLEQLCAGEPSTRFELQIVNVLENPQLAVDNQVLVTPALLVVEPAPGGLIIGNLSEMAKVRSVLGLPGR